MCFHSFGESAFKDSPKDNQQLLPVSYTHLDVYKRQVFVHAFEHNFIGTAVGLGVGFQPRKHEQKEGKRTHQISTAK